MRVGVEVSLRPVGCNMRSDGTMLKAEEETTRGEGRAGRQQVSRLGRKLKSMRKHETNGRTRADRQRKGRAANSEKPSNKQEEELSAIVTKSHPNGGERVSCTACEKSIQDKYLLSACDKFWHKDCLKCDHCHETLFNMGPVLYEKSGLRLCQKDYHELFGSKCLCSICGKLISGSELVMRAKTNIYHLECFACQLCGLRFCVGDRFYLCENKIVCQFDYDEHIVPLEKSFYPPIGSTIDQQSSHYHQVSGGYPEEAAPPVRAVDEHMAYGYPASTSVGSFAAGEHHQSPATTTSLVGELPAGGDVPQEVASGALAQSSSPLEPANQAAFNEGDDEGPCKEEARVEEGGAYLGISENKELEGEND